MPHLFYTLFDSLGMIIAKEGVWDGTFALQYIKLICKKSLISSHTITEKKK